MKMGFKKRKKFCKVCKVSKAYGRNSDNDFSHKGLTGGHMGVTQIMISAKRA